MIRNTVQLRPDGLIEIRVVGDQTVESVQVMGGQARALAEQQAREHLPVRVLDVLFDMGKVPPEARKRVVELAKSLDYDRLAMVGSSGMLQLGANLMLHATGKGDKVKFFTDYDLAVQWLSR